MDTPSGPDGSEVVTPRNAFSKAPAALVESQDYFNNELASSTHSGKKLNIFLNGGGSGLASEVNIGSKRSSRQSSIHQFMRAIDDSDSDMERISKAEVLLRRIKVATTKATSQRFVHFKDEPEICEFNASEDFISSTERSGQLLNKAMCDTDRLSDDLYPKRSSIPIDPALISCSIETGRRKNNTRFQLGIYDKLNFLDVCKKNKIGSFSSEKNHEDESANKAKTSNKSSFLDVNSKEPDILAHQKIIDKIIPDRSIKSRSASHQVSERDSRNLGIITPPDMMKIKMDREALHNKFNKVMDAVKKKKSNNSTADTFPLNFNRRNSSKSVQRLPEFHVITPKPKRANLKSSFKDVISSVKCASSLLAKAKSFCKKKSSSRSSRKSNYKSFIHNPDVQPFALSEAHCQRLSNHLVPPKSLERSSAQVSGLRKLKKSKKPLTMKSLIDEEFMHPSISKNISGKKSPKIINPQSAFIRRSPVFFSSDINKQSSLNLKNSRVDIAKRLQQTNSLMNYNIRVSVTSESSAAYQSQRNSNKIAVKKILPGESIASLKPFRENASNINTIKWLEAIVRHSPNSKKTALINSDSDKRRQLLQLTKRMSPISADRPLAKNLLSKIAK